MSLYDELFTSPVDFIKLAGQKSPGLADIIGAKRELVFNVRQPQYASGAVTVYQRTELAEFDVRLRLYNQVDLDDYQTFSKLLAPPRGPGFVSQSDSKKVRSIKALDIWHPLLAELDITSVVVKHRTQLEQVDDGVWSVTIKFLEQRGTPKLPKAIKKVEGSKAAPVDPHDKQILDNDEEIHRLAEENAKL